MGNIARIRASIELSGTNVEEQLAESITGTLAGLGFSKSEPVVQTTETAIVMPGVTNPGWVLVKNLDEANFVELTCTSGVYGTVKIPAGSPVLFYMDGAALYGKADTAPVQLEVFALPQ